MAEEKTKKTTVTEDTVDETLSTPYDDVFRTLLDKCKRLIIPVINEIFGTDYPMDEAFDMLSNEHYIVSSDGKNVKKITDSCVKIRNRMYHIECESTAKTGIEVRMTEYDFGIAIAHRYKEGSHYVIRFPESAVIYLRHNSRTPNKLKVIMIMPNGRKIHYTMPVMKVQKYTMETIFEKHLYFLIPFYIFRYENAINKNKNSRELFRQILVEYADIFERIEELADSDVIDSASQGYLKELTRYLIQIVSKNNKYIQEVIGMGGQVLELETDKWVKKLEEAKNDYYEIQNELSKAHDELGKTQDELGKTQDELGKTQDELGKTQDELGKTQDELGKTQDELDKTQDELDKAQSENERLKAEIQRLTSKLDS